MADDDLDQRNVTIEESTAMTIDFLRARLLSERSVSRSARQRADELARRVLELEEQLKIVSLERMRAEKATADVLAILESNGATDVSEDYDSNSDDEATPCGSEVGPNPSKQAEAGSLSDGRSCGRSLSWKSENSLRSAEKKYTNSSRRRHSSFISSANSSPKHMGKSCRRIKRRETTSAVEELHVDTNRPSFEGGEVAESPVVPTSSEIPATSKEFSGSRDDNYLFEGSDLAVLENQRLSNDHSSSGHAGDEDIERALEQQAQLIHQFEAEEKAQRDWEDKYRETNSHTPVSFDVGNHSDVTDDRDESREPAPPFREQAFVFQNQETTTNAGLSISYEAFRDQKSSSNNALKPETSEIAVSMSKNSYDEQQSAAHQFPPVSHYAGVPTNILNKEASGSKNQYALMPHDTSDKLGSVLEALQQAKASLKQNLNRSPISEIGQIRNVNFSVPVLRNEDRFEIPVGSAGLFRLPTDFQREATAQGHFLSSGSQLSLTNFPPGPVADRYFPSPYLQSKSSNPNDALSTTRTNHYMDPRSTMPTTFPVFRNTLDLARNIPTAYSSPDPYSSAGVPSASRYLYPDYPSYPEMVQRTPADDILSRPATNRDVGLRTPAHQQYHDDPRYYDDPRRYMYR